MLNRITIIGSGSWATALVKLFTESGISVSWLVRNAEFADYVRANRHNPRYISFAELNTDLINIFVDPDAAIHESDLIVLAVPSAYLGDAVRHIDKTIIENKSIVVSIKGFIPGTGMTPAMYIAEHFQLHTDEILVLGGPCHAEEMANQRSTYITLSGTNTVLVDYLCKNITAHYIHVISNNDPQGMEYASILKNIIGIASGIACGLHYGDNFHAVLVSNAMREAGRFIEYATPGDRDLFQSAYFGDLLVTAFSDYSRNRTLGKLVGRGMQVNKAIQVMEMIAEGFSASNELAPLLKRSKLNLPVINSVYRVLHQHANPYHEYKLLETQLN